MPTPPAKRPAPVPRITSVPTPALLNECYVRLTTYGAGLRHACNKDGVSGLHAWMTSYGARLESMAGVLRDEGARETRTHAKSAAVLYQEKTCGSPTALLEAVERIQLRILAVYDQLNLRLDMDEELYEALIAQEVELRETLDDIRELRLGYEAFGSATA